MAISAHRVAEAQVRWDAAPAFTSLRASTVFCRHRRRFRWLRDRWTFGSYPHRHPPLTMWAFYPATQPVRACRGTLRFTTIPMAGSRSDFSRPHKKRSGARPPLLASASGSSSESISAHRTSKCSSTGHPCSAPVASPSVAEPFLAEMPWRPVSWQQQSVGCWRKRATERGGRSCTGRRILRGGRDRRPTHQLRPSPLR